MLQGQSLSPLRSCPPEPTVALGATLAAVPRCLVPTSSALRFTADRARTFRTAFALGRIPQLGYIRCAAAVVLSPTSATLEAVLAHSLTASIYFGPPYDWMPTTSQSLSMKGMMLSLETKMNASSSGHLRCAMTSSPALLK